MEVEFSCSDDQTDHENEPILSNHAKFVNREGSSAELKEMKERIGIHTIVCVRTHFF